MRRRRIAALAIAIVLTTAGTACQKADVESLNMPPLSTVSLDFSDFPDGEPPATFGDGPSKVSVNETKTDPGARFRIADGKLTIDPTEPGQTGSYFHTPDLGEPVVKIGARWVFKPRQGTPDGAMALVVSNKIFRPPFPVHLSVTAYGWGYGVWPPMEGEEIPELDMIMAGRFDPPLEQDGTTVYETEVLLNGDRALIRLPDGQRRTVRDKRIADWAGHYATFEAWAKDGLTDSTVAFTEVWAGTRAAP
ncbi:hypothetical protein [Mycolicibacterium sp. XJ1819]